MNILDEELKQQISQDILIPIVNGNFTRPLAQMPAIIDKLIANIPANRRGSYGRVHVIKILSSYLFTELASRSMPIFDIASTLFDRNTEPRSRGVWLGILSQYGELEFQSVLPIFQTAAAASHWEIREFAQMFFRKLIKRHPEASKAFLLRLVKSENPNLRRFVAETLRPVQENQWFYKTPDYPLSVLRYLFTEKVAYPRTAVGNNLSDLARHLPNCIYSLVKELVASGDKNSYWIAYRACRNLVKKEPEKVMKILRVDEYRYKSRIYHLSDYE